MDVKQTVDTAKGGIENPAYRRPDPVGDDGVDEAREECGVHQVGSELSALGDRAGSNTGAGDSESPLRTGQWERRQTSRAVSKIEKSAGGEKNHIKTVQGQKRLLAICITRARSSAPRKRS